MDDQTSIPQDDANQIQKKVLDAVDAVLVRYNNILKSKESLKIEYVLNKMELAYYRMWRSDANAVFRRIIVLKHRRDSMKKGGRH